MVFHERTSYALERLVRAATHYCGFASLAGSTAVIFVGLTIIISSARSSSREGVATRFAFRDCDQIAVKSVRIVTKTWRG